MESSLEFRVEDLLQRTEIYSVKKYDYTVDKLPFSKFHKLSKESNELITKVTFPEFKHQQKNVSPGSYEGGYTIWESTWILLVFLDNIKELNSLSVLELGSGIGVCGAFLGLKGHNVTFQDLNLNVIEKGLIPNIAMNESTAYNMDKNAIVRINLKVLYEDNDKNLVHISAGFHNEKSSNSYEIVAGDWNNLVDDKTILGNFKNKFDLIITSECIYRTENYESIVKMVLSFMKESGRAYVATKRFYFGLTGGTFQFLQYVKESNFCNNYKLCGKIIKSVEPKNSSNVIDIIEITKVPNVSI
ncbi:putative methyltransferase family protein [Theileria parva strain Muguga]|uniref:putative methyltransferase family protein n=1 Tax=Theileria parva strain Muguga TaxID=333668 RepID=UPI001C621731|nr:putative methyltransferase family protein [Theileria parva strain Muguga]KAF5153098.1 putative methyltransferase family protein [Theileria parva strain Muguga]